MSMAPTDIKPCQTMEMSVNKDLDIGGRISGRHGGAADPGASLSSSCEGPMEGLPTGPSRNNASVEVREGAREGLVTWTDTDPSGDDEMDIDIVRGVKRKNNRSRILDDSLEEVLSLSPKEKPQKKKRTQKKGVEIISPLGEVTLVNTEGFRQSPLQTSTPQRLEWRSWGRNRQRS